MSVLPKSINKLIHELSKLPGIGHRSAQRLVFYLLKTSDYDRGQLASAISDLTSKLSICQQCHNLSENLLCEICADKTRARNLICVVEEPMDVIALEQGKSFSGTYHVLGGVISPIDGINPDSLKIEELLERIRGMDAEVEIIIATNLSLEGEGTAMYLARELKNIPKVKITRIAHGLPIGGDIEYADELTISKALEGRREYQG